MSEPPGNPPAGAWLAVGRTTFYADSVAIFEKKLPRLTGWLRQLSGTRLWAPFAALMSCMLAGFMSFQPWPLDHPEWDNYEMKAAAPLRSMSAVSPRESHAAKLDFRLTVPLVAKALGLKRWGFRALYVLLTLGTLWLGYSFFLKWSGDKAAATLFTVALAAIPPGSEALIGRFFYDPAALFLGAACLMISRWWLLAILLFLLTFVDERSLLMLPAIWLHHSLRRDESALAWNRTASRSVAGCILLVLAAHGLVRLWLGSSHGLSLPVSTAGMGLKCLKENLRYFELMSLATLEFFWILLLPILWKLWSGRHRAATALYVMCLAAPLLSALLVYDVGRSMNFVLPAFVSLIGLLPLFHNTETLRSMMLGVAGLNLLFWNIDYVSSPTPGPPAIFQSVWFLFKQQLPV